MAMSRVEGKVEQSVFISLKKICIDKRLKMYQLVGLVITEYVDKYNANKKQLD